MIELDRGLEDVEDGHGRVVIVLGAAGLGKSALLGGASRAASAREFSVTHIRARGHRSQLPLGGLCERLDGPDNEGSDEGSTRSDVRPRAILVDDAHRVDAGGRMMLSDLAARIASRPVLVVVALRPYLLDDSGRTWLEDLSRLDGSLSITLLPLDRARSNDLIRTILPQADSEFCDSCTELTGGNPFLLNELTTWVSAHRLDPVREVAQQVLEPIPPRAIRRLIRLQVEELGSDAASLASALAFADQPTELHKAAEVAGLDLTMASRAADALLESGLIAPGEKLSFTAPIAAHCLRATIPEPLATRMRLEVDKPDAAGARDPHRTAQHLLLVPPCGDRRVVERLVELADLDEAEGNPGEAGILIRRALDERIDDPQGSARLLARLGHLNLMRGDGQSTAALATGVAALGHDRDRADGLSKLAIAHLEAGSPRDAAVAFEHATELVGIDDPLGAHAAMSGAFVGLLVPERRDEAATGIAEMRSHGCGSRSRAELQLATAWLATAQADPQHEVIQMVTAALADRRGDPSSGGYFHMVATAILSLTDEVAAANAVCERGLAGCGSSGAALVKRNLQLAQAFALFHCGRLEASATLCRQLLNHGSAVTRFNDATAAALLAEVLLESDLPGEAETLVRTALKWLPHELPALLLMQAQARLCLARDALAEALATAHEIEELALSLGILNPAVVAWRGVAAICHARLGDRRRAHELIDEATAAANRFGSARVRSLILRARAHAFEAPDELDHLERALSVIDRSPAALERAAVLVQYGSALHRAGRVHEARARLRRGVDLADRIGARRISREGLAALVAAGGRPRRVRLSGPQALTPAERKVVDLARNGASNREIAEKLVVTRKTVEWHLRKAYVKLGVSSRTQLARVMGHE